MLRWTLKPCKSCHLVRLHIIIFKILHLDPTVLDIAIQRYHHTHHFLDFDGTSTSASDTACIQGFYNDSFLIDFELKSSLLGVHFSRNWKKNFLVHVYRTRVLAGYAVSEIFRVRSKRHRSCRKPGTRDTNIRYLTRNVGCGHGTRATELKSNVWRGFLGSCSSHQRSKGLSEVKVDIHTLHPQSLTSSNTWPSVVDCPLWPWYSTQTLFQPFLHCEANASRLLHAAAAARSQSRMAEALRLSCLALPSPIL